MNEKKVLIYSPYWQTIGGGERYLLEIGKALEGRFRIFFLADKILKRQAREIFGISLQKAEFLDKRVFLNLKFFSRFQFIRQFDFVFYTTDGSLFFPSAKKNFLMIQSPVHIPVESFATRFKISGWQPLCYSKFMADIITKKLNKKPIILSPAVDMNTFSAKGVEKQKLIITVGRFFASSLHEKKQEFIISFFKKYHSRYFPGYRLIICGNLTEDSGSALLSKIKKNLENYPIELHLNIPFNRLTELYKKALIYWHAAGFGSNREKQPEKQEHFGITTLEAMAAGAVPVVYGEGGQKDIIQNGRNGFLWYDEESFLDKTRRLINNPKLTEKLSKKAVLRARDFSFAKFKKRINDLV